MRKSLLLSLLVLLLTGTRLSAAEAEISRPSHPNHYIILIDASGSTATDSKKESYRRALLEVLPRHFYAEGFGGHIPPYDPAEDYLTLQYFGVVTGHLSVPAAYESLADDDLRTDFIHPVWSRRKGVEIDELKQHVLPPQTYFYTLLSWAKPLSLNSLSPAGDDPAHRTFLIFVSDGEHNDHTPRAELDDFENKNKSYEETRKLVAEIENAYSFTDGEGAPRRAGSEPVGEGKSAIFVEAYEVVSNASAQWEAAAKALPRAGELRVRWTREGGAAPEGVLSASIDKRFVEWSKSAPRVEGSQLPPPELSLSVSDGAQAAEARGLELPFVSRGALTCGGRELKANVHASLWVVDRLLGRRRVDFVDPQTVSAPPPAMCRVEFYAEWGGIVLLCALAALGAAYFIYYRYYTTPLAVTITGQMNSIHLSRRGHVVAPVPAVPQMKVRALTLELPGMFKQRLFCRGATVSLGSKGGGALHWKEQNGDPQLRLPLARRAMAAYWSDLSQEPSQITVNFKQGRQQMNVDLSYPGGSDEHLKGV